MKKLLILVSITLIATLVSCTSRHSYTGGERPQWTYKGSTALTVNGQRVFRSVGIANDTGEEAMTLDASDAAARTNMSYLMKTYVKALRESYKRSIKTGEMPKAQFESDMTHVSEVMTKSKFSFAAIKNRWVSPKGTVYTLLELNLDQVNNMMKKAEGISQNLIDTVGERSKDAHERLQERLKEVGDF